MAQTMLKGTYRIMVIDASDMPTAVLTEIHSSAMGDGSTTAPTDAQLMPKTDFVDFAVTEDNKLTIWYKPDALITEAASGNAIAEVIRIPVTWRNKAKGQQFKKTLTASDFTECRAAAVSQKWEAGSWYQVKKLTIPAQQALKLGLATFVDNRVDPAILIHRQCVT
jgi:hypothetical protein